MLHKRESNFEMFDILGLALEVNKFIFKMTNRQGSHIASSPAVLCEEKKW